MPRHARQHYVVSYAQTAEPIEMPFELWNRVGWRKHATWGHIGATWRIRLSRLSCGLGWAEGSMLRGGTLAPPGEYDWAVRVRQRCGPMSNYFDQLLLLLLMTVSISRVLWALHITTWSSDSEALTGDAWNRNTPWTVISLTIAIRGEISAFPTQPITYIDNYEIWQWRTDAENCCR